MSRVHFTELTIRNLPTPQRGQIDFWDRDFRSFGVRCSCGGSKTFVLKQNNVRRTIGRYPIITLKEAREEARRRLALKYIPKPLTATVPEAVSDYLAHKKHNLKPTTYTAHNRILSKLPNKQLSAFTATDAPSKHREHFIIAKTFLNWCVETGRLSSHPLERLKPPYKGTTRDRVLTDEELQKIWLVTRSLTDYDRIVRLLLLSGQRLAQITHLQSSWLRDDALMVFPQTIMKSGHQHSIPFTDPIRTLMPTHQGYLFGGTKPFTNLSRSKLRIDQLLNIPHWTLHDLRRTFSTKMSEWEICPIDITEAMLDHTTGSRTPIQRIYDRHSRLQQMLRALKKYHARLLALLEPQA